METTNETYFVNFGGGTVYYQVIDGRVYSKDRLTNITIQQFLDYIAAAKELGHKAGRI